MSAGWIGFITGLVAGGVLVIALISAVMIAKGKCQRDLRRGARAHREGPSSLPMGFFE